MFLKISENRLEGKDRAKDASYRIISAVQGRGDSGMEKVVAEIRSGNRCSVVFGCRPSRTCQYLGWGDGEMEKRRGSRTAPIICFIWAASR